MKDTKVSNRNGFSSSIWGCFLVALAMAGCDTFESDVVTPEVEIKKSDIYVLAGGDAVIDLRNLLSANFAGRLEITAPPTRGSMKSLSEGIVQYLPANRQARGSDSFEFTVFTLNNAVVTKDTVFIHVETDSTKLPCAIYPIADYVYGSAPGEAVTIDVVRNDILCNKVVETSIYKPTPAFVPHHGTAEVNGTSIVYTPGSTFAGRDTIIYKLTNRYDATDAGYGFVYIDRDPACGFTLRDDAYELDSLKSFETVYLPVFENDDLCDSLAEYTIAVTTNPAHGSVAFAGNGFNYTLPAIAGEGFEDTFVYEVRRNGTQKSARVTLRTGSTPTTPCVFRAVTDSLDLSGNTIPLMYLNVLYNDDLCDALQSITITRAPVHGTAFIDEETKAIGYSRNQFLNDSLQYEICNGTYCSRATAYIRQEK
jgi:hypothetical protein